MVLCFFRTSLLDAGKARYATSSIGDSDPDGDAKAMWSGYDCKEQGDPAKPGAVLAQIAPMDTPPHQLIAGSDAVAVAEPALAARLTEMRDFA